MTKPHICITLEKEYLDWLKRKVRNKTFASFSHGIEVLIRERMKDEGCIKDE